MSEFHALRRDGTPWQPMFVEEINGETCIGCGRCFKPNFSPKIGVMR
jgi:ferredoxin